MTLPLLAFAVLGCLLLAWVLEFRHKEEILPTLQDQKLMTSATEPDTARAIEWLETTVATAR